MRGGRRKPKGKTINPTLFVFCEGDTEVAYVNFLKAHYRLPSIQVHSKIGGNNISTTFIANYKRDKPTHEKDINFLMYDIDVPGILDRLEQIDNCKLLVSNPCIELWFLLHYKTHSANSDCRYFCKELTNRNRTYKKGVIDNRLRDKLIAKPEQATERAKKLRPAENPSTTVYRFLEKLNALKS